MILVGFTNTTNQNIPSFHPSLCNCHSEIVEILWYSWNPMILNILFFNSDAWGFIFSYWQYLISHFLQSILVSFSSKHDNHRSIACSRLLIMLRDITYAKLSSTTWTGSNYFTIFPEVMGRPSIKTTKVGQRSFFFELSDEVMQNFYPWSKN